MSTRNPTDHYWYARNPSRIKRKTAHLSNQQMGIYDRLLDWYYENRKPLPIGWVQLHRICSALAPDEQEDLQAVVQEFFTMEDDGWHQRTADEEIAKAADLSQKRREAQAERERKRLANAGTNAPVLHPTTTTTTTDSSKEESLRVRGSRKIEGKDFADFMAAYPKKTQEGAARSAFANAILMHGADPAQVIGAAKAYAVKKSGEDERYILNPAKWLETECYKDPDLNKGVIKELSVDDFTGWRRTIAKAHGPVIAKAWFTQADLDEENGILAMNTNHARDFVRQHYGQTLKDMGITEITVRRES